MQKRPSTLRLALRANRRGRQLSRGHDHTTRNNIEERCLEQPDVGLYVTGLVDSHTLCLEFQEPKRTAKPKPVSLTSHKVSVHNKFETLSSSLTEETATHSDKAFDKIVEHHTNMFGPTYTP